MAKKRIIGQKLASSAPPTIGMTLTEDMIKELCEQTPSTTPIYPDHDTSLRPAGILYNKRLERGSDGYLAIVADVELEEDLDLQKYHGFSIGFLGKSVYAPANPSAIICLDARYFDENDLRFTAGETPSGLSVGGRHIFRYSLTATVVTCIITFTTLQAAQGFFSKIGSELASFIIGKLRALSRKSESLGVTTNFDFSFTVNEAGYVYDVFIRADLNDLKVIELGIVSIDDLQKEVRGMLDPSKIKKVHAQLTPFAPYLCNIRCTQRANSS